MIGRGVILEGCPLQSSTFSDAIPTTAPALGINMAGNCPEESKSLGSNTLLCMGMLELKDKRVFSTLACISNSKG